MLFFSDVVDFQDSATSSNELPGSSLTSLSTLQKKETWLLLSWKKGYQFFSSLLLYEDAETQSDLDKSDKYPPLEGQYNAYFSHHKVFFLRKRFITQWVIFYIGTTKFVKFPNVSYLHIIKY